MSYKQVKTIAEHLNARLVIFNTDKKATIGVDYHKTKLSYLNEIKADIKLDDKYLSAWIYEDITIILTQGLPKKEEEEFNLRWDIYEKHMHKYPKNVKAEISTHNVKFTSTHEE